MCDVVFRLNLRTRLRYSIPFWLTLALAGWFAFKWLPEDHPLDGSLNSLIPIFIPPLLTGLYSLFMWGYRLELTEAYLQTRSIFFPFRSPRRCTYADVAQVRRGPSRGVLEIVPKTGGNLRLDVDSFDERLANVLDELLMRVHADRIQPNLATILWADEPMVRSSWLKTLGRVLYLGVHLALVATVLGSDVVRDAVSWNSTVRLGDLASVESFSLNEDGTPWLIARLASSHNYQVWHVTETRTAPWRLTLGSGMFSFEQFEGVVPDGAGLPHLLHQGEVLAWTGDVWQPTPLPSGSLRPSVWRNALTTLGAKLWAVHDYGDPPVTVLLEMNFTSGEWRTSTAPDSATQAGFALSGLYVSPSGQLLALTESQHQAKLYFRQDDHWLEPGYLIDQPLSAEIIDITLDSAGRPWVLSRPSVNGEYALGRLDPDTAVWTWYSLASCCGLSERYETLVVDPLGRLWVEGEYDELRRYDEDFVAVFDAPANGQALEKVRYTTLNSNYQQGYDLHLRLGPDGRLWAAGRALVWIDGTAADLPQPFPDWVVALTGRGNELTWLLLALATQMISLVMRTWQQKARANRVAQV